MHLPLKIAVCEDSHMDSKQLIFLLKQSGCSVECMCFESGESFTQSFAKGKYDLIFLDIYLGGISGVDVAEAIRQQDRNVVVIFTTTSEDFTKEGYRLNAYKYLLKPLSISGIADALELARLKRDKAIHDVCTVVSEGEAKKIPLDDIFYADVHGHKSLLHTIDGTTETNISIDSLEKLLPPPRFLRCHRSYIVNLDYVMDIDDDFILANGEKVYIRVKDYKKMKAAYEDYIFEQERNVGL